MVHTDVLVLPKFCKIVWRVVFGRICSIVFLAFTLKLPIQTLQATFSGAPDNLSKTSTPLGEIKYHHDKYQLLLTI